eukprot:RCo013760
MYVVKLNTVKPLSPVEERRVKLDRKQIGEHISCCWRDGFYYDAEIIDKRVEPTGEPSFYVHYTDLDRRLDEWVPGSRVDVDGEFPVKAPEAELSDHGSDTGERQTRGRKRTVAGLPAFLEEDEPMDAETLAFEKERLESTKVKNIQWIVFGRWEVDAWYYSPYPESLTRGQPWLLVCEWCLLYMRKARTFATHQRHCPHRAPVGGRLIYRK